MRILAIAPMLLLSCGGTGSVVPQANSCSVTLSGAQSGTYGCNTAVAAFDSGQNRGQVAAGSSAGPTVVIAITFPGAPHAGTYRLTDAGAQGGVSVSTQAGATWQANTGTGTSAVGSYTLNLTGVTPLSQSGTLQTYLIAGTLDASLPAVASSGSSGTVTLHTTF